jgi:hypothetical protein
MTKAYASRSVLSWGRRFVLPAAGGLMLAGALTAAGVPASAHPSAASIQGGLQGVSALSPSDAWAVGAGAGNSPPLILHWTGRAWSSVAVPDIPYSILTGVSMTSASDGWAVGWYASSAGPQVTLILHWNGTSWTQVTSPSPPGGAFLTGVSMTSASDGWAVGWYYASTGIQTLILHWNGTSWTQVPSAQGGMLEGVSAASASDAWAVGATGSATMTLHWDGTSWTQVPSPNPGPFGGDLSAVSDTSATSAWAVGDYQISNNVEKTLTLHWNGTTWSQVTSHTPHHFAWLTSVSTVSRSDAWAAGTWAKSGEQASLMLHWNGARWTKVASPGHIPFGIFNLNAVSMDSATDGWAVGNDATTGPDILLLRWNGTTWTRYWGP